MPLPALTESGVLPPGVFDATLLEVEERFSSTNLRSRRAYLWPILLNYLSEVRATGLFDSAILAGSFVSDTENPGDVDLILVLPEGKQLSERLDDPVYELVSRRRASANLEFDVLTVDYLSSDYEDLIDFFQRSRSNPTLRKGVVRILL